MGLLESRRTGDSDARMIQTLAATHHRLLPGDLRISDKAVEVRGVALAPAGLTHALKFFINGRPVDELHYPAADETMERRFSEIDGIGGFYAAMRSNTEELLRDRYLRVDASPTGAYVAHDWRHAMWFSNPLRETLPMPPADNIIRVVGDANTARFCMGGASIVQKVRSYLCEMGRDWNAITSILDWGCGAGRISRYLLTESRAYVFGVDIDGDNVAWCRENLHPGRFEKVPLSPPTQLPSTHFDLVIGTSVMTHLTEDMQFAWLAELQRITKPGAILFLSISGPVQFAFMGLSTTAFMEKERLGFIDARRDASLDGHVDDPAYYRTVWHSRAYVREQWGKYFDVLAIVDGIAALQDFVVLQRRLG